MNDLMYVDQKISEFLKSIEPTGFTSDDDDISKLSMSRRTKNALGRYFSFSDTPHYMSIGFLSGLRDVDILRVPGIGKKGLEEIHYALAIHKYGLELLDYLNEPLEGEFDEH